MRPFLSLLLFATTLMAADRAFPTPRERPDWWRDSDSAMPMVTTEDWRVGGPLASVDGTVTEYHDARAVRASVREWQTVSPKAGIEFDPLFGERMAVAVAVTRLRLTTAGSVRLVVASDDSCRIWIADQLVIDHPVGGTVFDNRVEITLDLAAGAHELTAAVGNMRGQWALRVIAVPAESHAVHSEIRHHTAALEHLRGGARLAAHRRLSALYRVLPWSPVAHEWALHHARHAAHDADGASSDGRWLGWLLNARMMQLIAIDDSTLVERLEEALHTDLAVIPRYVGDKLRAWHRAALARNGLHERWLEATQALEAASADPHLRRSFALERARFHDERDDRAAVFDAVLDALGHDPSPGEETFEASRLLAATAHGLGRHAEAFGGALVVAAFAARPADVAVTATLIERTAPDHLTALETLQRWRSWLASGKGSIGNPVPIATVPEAAPSLEPALRAHLLLRLGRGEEAHKALQGAPSDPLSEQAHRVAQALGVVLPGAHAPRVGGSDLLAAIDQRRGSLLKNSPQLTTADPDRVRAVCLSLIADRPGLGEAQEALAGLQATFASEDAALAWLREHAPATEPRLAFHRLQVARDATPAQRVGWARAFQERYQAHPLARDAAFIELQARFEQGDAQVPVLAEALVADLGSTDEQRARALLVAAFALHLDGDTNGALERATRALALHDQGEFGTRVRRLIADLEKVERTR